MNEYSKINYPFLKKCKKEYKDNNKFFEEYFDDFLKNSKGRYKEKNIKSFECIFLKSMIDYNKTINNYYIESKELSDFLCNTIIKKEILLNLVNMLKKKLSHIGYSSIDNKKLYAFHGIIHHKSFLKSIFISFSFREDKDNFMFYFTDGENGIGQNINIDNKETILNIIKENNVILNLVLNMLFYMDAFPDKISNTPPEEMCDKLNFKNSKTISISKDIEDYLHENREVSPHLRRGHFRFLDSKYYKNKKGQTVFVKSSFVKGKAVTVTE